MCMYLTQIYVETYLNVYEAKVISAALQHKSKFNLDIFWKKNHIFGFSCCSTREDLSIDVSITNVWLIDKAKVLSALQHK